LQAWSLLPERHDRPKRRPLMAASVRIPGKNGFRYRECFGVVVLCEDAADQEDVFNRLKALGFSRLKVVVV
jgi:hypothetical protein